MYSADTAVSPAASKPKPLKTLGNLTTNISCLSYNHDAQLLAMASNVKKDQMRLVRRFSPPSFFFARRSRRQPIDPPPVSHRLWKLADDEYSSGPCHRDGFFYWERIPRHRKQSWTRVVVPTQRLWGAMMTQVSHCNKKNTTDTSDMQRVIQGGK